MVLTKTVDVASGDVGQEQTVSEARSRFNLPVALVGLGLVATAAWLCTIVGALVWLIID
jgi:hypothetical protein